MRAPNVITMPPLHPAQRIVYAGRRRFTVLNCGRRWGKTRFAASLAIEAAAAGGAVWIVAPTYAQATIGWRMVTRYMRGLPVTVNRAERRLTYPSGGYVQAKSADNPDSLRGEGLDFVVLDECAFMHPDTWYQALRPALSDRVGRALFVSTPNGRNWFWSLYQHAADPANADEWAAYTMPTSSNPYIRPTEIDAARAALPEMTFRQEYLAEFIEDGAGVFRGVREVATLQPLAAPRPGAHYVCGVDVATEQDYTVAVVMDADTGDMVYMDRYNRCTYPELEQRLDALYRRWRIQIMIVESNSIGRGVIDHLRARGLSIAEFRTTATTKQPLIQALQSAIEHREVRLLNDPVLIAELQAYESERTATGVRYSAPPGGHDDTVMALALACHARGSRLQVYF